MTLTHPFDPTKSMFMSPTSLPQLSLAAQSPQSGQVWSLGGSIGAGVVPLKDGNGASRDDDSETDPLKDSPPSSTIEGIGSTFKHMSVAPTPLPRARKPEGISMNPGGYCKCFHVVYMCAFSVISFVYRIRCNSMMSSRTIIYCTALT